MASTLSNRMEYLTYQTKDVWVVLKKNSFWTCLMELKLLFKPKKVLQTIYKVTKFDSCINNKLK
jgi:hypothetical protein